VLFLSGFFLRRLMGDLGTPKLPKEMPGNTDTATRPTRCVRSGPTRAQNALCRYAAKNVSFGGLNDVRLDFGSQIPKNVMLAHE